MRLGTLHGARHAPLARLRVNLEESIYAFQELILYLIPRSFHCVKRHLPGLAVIHQDLPMLDGGDVTRADQPHSIHKCKSIQSSPPAAPRFAR